MQEVLVDELVALNDRTFDMIEQREYGEYIQKFGSRNTVDDEN